MTTGGALMEKRIKREDLLAADPWRVFRIMSEFVDGFESLRDIGGSSV